MKHTNELTTGHPTPSTRLTCCACGETAASAHRCGRVVSISKQNKLYRKDPEVNISNLAHRLIVLLLLLATALPSASSQAAPASSSAAPPQAAAAQTSAPTQAAAVEPKLLAQIEKSDKVTAWVMLRTKADLSDAPSIKGPHLSR